MTPVLRISQSFKYPITSIPEASEIILKTNHIAKNVFNDLGKRFFVKKIGIDLEPSLGKNEIQKPRPVVQIAVSDDQETSLIMPLSSQKLENRSLIISGNSQTNLIEKYSRPVPEQIRTIPTNKFKPIGLLDDPIQENSLNKLALEEIEPLQKAPFQGQIIQFQRIDQKMDEYGIVISNSRRDGLLQAVPLIYQHAAEDDSGSFIPVQVQLDKTNHLKLGYAQYFNIIRVSKEQRRFLDEKITYDSVQKIYDQIRIQINKNT